MAAWMDRANEASSCRGLRFRSGVPPRFRRNTFQSQLQELVPVNRFPEEINTEIQEVLGRISLLIAPFPSKKPAVCDFFCVLVMFRYRRRQRPQHRTPDGPQEENDVVTTRISDLSRTERPRHSWFRQGSQLFGHGRKDCDRRPTDRLRLFLEVTTHRLLIHILRRRVLVVEVGRRVDDRRRVVR